MSHPTPPSAARPDLPQRSHCRLRLWITDARGLCRCYMVVPQQHLTDCLRAYRLTRGPDEHGPGASYLVRLFEDGRTECDCPGHRHQGHCKHQDCLVSVGLFEAHLIQQLCQLIAEVKEKETRLAAALPVAPPPRNVGRGRRRVKPAAVAVPATIAA